MNKDEEEFCVDVQFRYPTTAAGGLKTVGLDLRLHYIEFKSARYVLCRLYRDTTKTGGMEYWLKEGQITNSFTSYTLHEA